MKIESDLGISMRRPIWQAVRELELPRQSILGVFAVLHLGLSSIHAWRASPTIDEPSFMAAGVAHWQTSRFEPYAVNPPLVRMLATLPVLVLNPRSEWKHVGVSVFARPETLMGKDFHRRNSVRIRQFYFAARMVCTTVSIFGLIVSSQWASKVFGNSAGTTTAALWCFSPLMLGHGSLMTPDVGAAVSGLCAFYALRCWLFASEMSNAVTLGLCTGLAFATKFTWIPVIPVCFLLLWGVWRIATRSLLSSLRTDLKQISVVVVVALLVVNFLYGFEGTFRPLGEILLVSETLASRSGDSEAANRFSDTWLANLRLPLPTCLLQGIDLQKSGFESEEYSRSYLHGTWKNGGWWYYYVVAALVKLPLSFIALVAVTVLLVSAARFGRTDSISHLWWFEQLCLVIPAIALVAFVSSETGFNRHFRYALPVYPFLMIFTSQASQSRLVVVKRVVILVLVLQSISVLWHGPHWLSYFNELAGGPRRGGSWLLSSNIDWGQDLYYLRDWQHGHADAQPFYYALYSSIDPASYGIQGNPLQPQMLDVESLPAGYYAISENLLRGYEINGFASGDFELFQSAQPTASIGYSICIFALSGNAGVAE